MKKQDQSQPVIAHQIKGEGIPQGPAFHHSDPEQEWSDGNGY